MHNSNSTSNLTDITVYHDHFTFARGVVMLVLCVFGLYGNVISILIFTRSSMRSSINVLLSGLSIIDMFLLLMCIPVFIMPVLLEYYEISFRYYNPVIMLILYPFTLIAQTASVWTFIVISVERYLAVCRPFQLQKYVTIGRTKLTQFVVIILSVLYNLIRFWEYRFKYEQVEEVDGELYETLLRLNSHYFAIYYTALYLLTHFLLPFLIILILNVYVVGAIKHASEERRRLSSAQIQQHRTTRMIIIVTIMFALCNVITFFLNIWESCNPDLFNADSSWSGTAFVLLDVSNISIMINSSVNFVVYLIYCRRYRILFLFYNKRLLLCTSTKSDPSFITSQSSYVSGKNYTYTKSSITCNGNETAITDKWNNLIDNRKNSSEVNL